MKSMSMKSMFVGIMAGAVLAGCGNDVPAVEDPSRIVIRGKLVSQQDYLQTYCRNRHDNPTCAKVSKSIAAESARAGPVPVPN